MCKTFVMYVAEGALLLCFFFPPLCIKHAAYCTCANTAMALLVFLYSSPQVRQSAPVHRYSQHNSATILFTILDREPIGRTIAWRGFSTHAQPEVTEGPSSFNRSPLINNASGGCYCINLPPPIGKRGWLGLHYSFIGRTVPLLWKTSAIQHILGRLCRSSDLEWI